MIIIVRILSASEGVHQWGGRGGGIGRGQGGETGRERDKGKGEAHETRE